MKFLALKGNQASLLAGADSGTTGREVIQEEIPGFESTYSRNEREGALASELQIGLSYQRTS